MKGVAGRLASYALKMTSRARGGGGKRPVTVVNSAMTAWFRAESGISRDFSGVAGERCKSLGRQTKRERLAGVHEEWTMRSIAAGGEHCIQRGLSRGQGGDGVPADPKKGVRPKG